MRCCVRVGAVRLIPNPLPDPPADDVPSQAQFHPLPSIQYRSLCEPHAPTPTRLPPPPFFPHHACLVPTHLP